ncbi:MAG: biotin synthase BioB [Verrucomicrobiota bacterium]
MRRKQYTMLQQITKNAIEGKGCSQEEALWLTHQKESELLESATQVREAHFGNKVRLCSIVNAKSGKCDMNCRFCSQSAHNTTEIETYPFIDTESLESQIHETIDSGDRLCGVVTSGGRLSTEEIQELAATVRKIGGGSKAPVCGSLGRLLKENLVILKEAGLTRFHHNLEASEGFYSEVCTTQQWSERLATVKAAMEAGMAVCSGGLFGLGESWKDRIDLALTLRDLGVDSVPINFLYAHSGTPLKDMPPLSAEEALRIIAVYRFLLPTTTLRVCGGRAHILGDRQDDLFAAGANGLMTGNYLTVAGSQYKTDLAMIQKLGLEIATV